MRYALFADIHANLAALKAVLADAEAQKCDRFACLGDLVGYGAEPRECVELVRKIGIPCVKGNHDEYCSTEADSAEFSPSAAGALKWTRTQLSQDDREWLASLDYLKILDGFTIVHSALNEPHRWGYVFNKLDAVSTLTQQTTQICFIGHTHLPLAFVQESTASGQPLFKGGTYSKFQLDAAKKYCVNPGSVGQPRDNNPKAAYAIYDLGKGVIELRRLDYDRSSLGGGDAPAPLTPTPRRPISGGAHNTNNLN